MKSVKSLLIIFVCLYANMSFAQINLNITFLQLIDGKKVLTTKTIRSEYDKDIVLTHEIVKEQIVLNLKKVRDVVMNGSIIKPVQVDLRLVGADEKLIGKPQTVTTFYTKAAQFSIPGIGKEKWLNLSVNFQEI